MKTTIRILLVAVVSLMILGLIMVFSSSNMYSQVRFNNLYFLFSSHSMKVLASVVLMLVFAFIPYEKYKEISKYLLIGVTVLLFITLFMPKFNGASRWLIIGPIRFQPSDLAKLVLIIHLSALLAEKGDKIKSFGNGLLYALIWVFVVCGLILFQPNVSTSMIIMFLSFTILYIGGARFKHIFATVAVTLVLAAVVAMILPHSRERILTYIGSMQGAGEPNIQVSQAKIALGSGGWFGLGLGQSRQSDLFLPESYGDFIFSVLGEEIGFIGAVITLLIFLAVFIMGLKIASRAPDRFSSLLAFGLSFNIVISAFINAGVVTGLVPTTGITLPFISFGGTSIILFGISIGILLNIGNSCIEEKTIVVEESA
jgi:cell division protein FtsW